MAYASEVARGGWALARKARRLPRIAFIAVVSVLMLAPLAAHLAGVQGRPPAGENRRLADPPKLPQTAREVLKLPGQVDAYLNDHFGLRRLLIEANDRIQYALFGSLASPQLTPGKDGFIFFTSHNAQDPLSLVRFLCGQSITPPWIEETASKIGGFVRQAMAQHPASTLLIVPTKTVLYAEKLPDWLQAQCRRGLPPVPGVVAQLQRDPRTAPHVLYPYEPMMAMKASFDVFPKENFHWDGEGPHRVARHVAETALRLPRLADLPAKPGSAPSDVQHFVPGVPLSIRTMIPDYAAAGVTACSGGACFPELGEAAGKLFDVSRYRSSRTGAPKLLLISDSFGHGVAGYFSEYFGEVWHLSTNHIDQLTPEELARVKDVAFRAYAPDRILYVYHDFATGYFTTSPLKLLNAGPATR